MGYHKKIERWHLYGEKRWNEKYYSHVVSLCILFKSHENNFDKKRGRTTNGETGPFADHIYEIWNCTIFVIGILRGKSKLCLYAIHSL